MALIRAPPPVPIPADICRAHLVIPTPAAAAAAAAANKRKTISSAASSCLLVIECNLRKQQQQQQQRHTVTTTSSPLHAAEDLAARLGLEMAAAGLEVLFRDREAFGTGDHPPPASPCRQRRPVRVAYQGVPGSYCQEAAAEAYRFSSHLPFLPCPHMEAAFAALEDGSADRAVVPIENSLDGPIPRNLDLLLRYPEVRIVGELLLPVNHCLLALPGAPRSALRRVISHPQALDHCHHRLWALDLGVEEVSSAADAARLVAEGRISDTAVIGSRIAAREFGLQVLEENFQDQGPGGGNVTRFLQLALGATTTGTVTGKTTVAFSLPSGPSDLFRAMWAFESRGVRVARVDHRPNRSSPVRVVDKAAYLDYVFVLDLEGNESDAHVRTALARLREFAGFVRVLGSYGSTCATRSPKIL
ncbi:arogenate dehydratase/prephenate dehydratase 2, chloroplastic-like [Phoenix dactylifera]|uniref:Arogenate dehydratase/prephenate dehydratase 2, chloroplastic-like n=1 Tax=Phoenix dactylifera TaxID=42345 RepID=A0A8B7CGD6_PHODC|nr:arogenate dehydratase/prephenate dehydratase 2, chloroplastic-like [Phoenix dactylifera]